MLIKSDSYLIPDNPAFGTINLEALRFILSAFFSLIESAKANDLEPYGYLRHIFKNLPLAQTQKDLKDLLPQNIDPDTIAVIGQD